ncbi:MAG: hypothetical protein AAGD22_04260 [Verrucomicrobiota bacterium]
MLRFIITVIMTAAVVTGWIVFNPSDSARQFLNALSLTEILQENYRTPSNSPLPQESSTTVSPQNPPPAIPTQNPSAATTPTGEFVTALPPTNQPKAFTPRGPDYDRLIANLEKENEQLKAKMKIYAERRQGSNVPSSDSRAIQRQIDANNARIAELKDWKSKAN